MPLTLTEAKNAIKDAREAGRPCLVTLTLELRENPTYDVLLDLVDPNGETVTTAVEEELQAWGVELVKP